MDATIDDGGSAWGFRYEEHVEGHARIGCTITPRHLNAFGNLHGGVLLTLLDEAGTIAGLFDAAGVLTRRAVTVSLNGQFVAPAQSGDIHAIGTVVGRGRKLYFSRAEVFDSAGILLAFGTSTHRYVGGS